jgi:hypothetical protein
MFIPQSSNGPDGQLMTATTIKYYQHMLNAVRPFATQHTYAISICDKLIQSLDQHILNPFRWFYPNHSTVHDLTGAYQHSQLPFILAAAQAVEDKVKQMQDIDHGMLGQGFYSSIIGGGEVPAFPSQAKKTPQRHGPPVYQTRRGDVQGVLRSAYRALLQARWQSVQTGC